MSTSPGDARSLSLLSVVVPCLDEALIIRETHNRLLSALDVSPRIDFEIIYVDDGSRDSTLDILRELQRSDERIKVISLTRNFGQFTALTAGVEHAVGDVVAIIDADLQDPPEVIPEMLQLWQQGADIVRGLRSNRSGESRIKIWSSRLFLRILNRISDTKFTSDTGEFGIFDRAAVDAFLEMPETRCLLRSMASWVGFNQETYPYERMPRSAGQTKYSMRKMIDLAVNTTISFTTFPLRIATWAGSLLLALAFLGIIYTLTVRLLTDAWISGWAIVSVIILTMGGLHLICLGIIGEYLGRTHIEVKRRPLYLVRERLGFIPERGGK